MSLQDQLNAVLEDIANHDGDPNVAKSSVDFCNLQIRYCKLMQLLATQCGDNQAAFKACSLAETWQKRLGEILKVQNLDLKRELLQRMEDRKKAANKLAALAEFDEDEAESQLH